MNKALIILAALFVFIGNSQESFELAAFGKANQAYTNENYDLAIAGYEQILKTGKHSAEVYFNLGNAYYRSMLWDPPFIIMKKRYSSTPKI